MSGSYNNIEVITVGAARSQILAIRGLFFNDGKRQRKPAFVISTRVAEKRRGVSVSFDGASQSLLHFRHGDDVAVEVETQTARATRDQIVRGLDEIRARADGTEHVVVARGEIIVHDGAQLCLFVGATSLVFSQDQFLFRLK